MRALQDVGVRDRLSGEDSRRGPMLIPHASGMLGARGRHGRIFDHAATVRDVLATGQSVSHRSGRCIPPLAKSMCGEDSGGE